jgi:hypothetical protein
MSLAATFAALLALAPSPEEHPVELVLGACIGGRAIALVELGNSHALEPIEQNHLRSLAELAKTLSWTVIEPGDGKPSTRRFAAPQVIDAPAHAAHGGEHVEEAKVVLGPCKRELEVYASRAIVRPEMKPSDAEPATRILAALFDEVCPPAEHASAGDCPRGNRSAKQSIVIEDARLADAETAVHAVRFHLTPATGDEHTRFTALVRAPAEGAAQVLQHLGSPRSKSAPEAEHTTVPASAWIEFDFMGPHRVQIARTETNHGDHKSASAAVLDLAPTGELRTLDVALSAN